MEILALSGSLRARSSNTGVLRTALEFASADAGAATATAGIGELPHFNPDLDGEGALAPSPVAELRAAVAAADGVLIVSPEYAQGVPGSLKNALDWLVGSGELVGTPVGVVTASPSPTGGEHAHAHLRGTLGKMSAEVIDGACLRIGLIGAKLDGTSGRLVDGEALRELRDAVRALTEAARARG